MSGGLGSFTGGPPALSSGLGSFGTPAPTVPTAPAPPSVNPNTGKTVFQQMVDDRNGPGNAVSDAQFYVGELAEPGAILRALGKPNGNLWVGIGARARQRLLEGGHQYDETRMAFPVPYFDRAANSGKNQALPANRAPLFFKDGTFEVVTLPANKSPLYTGDSNDPFGISAIRSGFRQRDAGVLIPSWESGFASGGLIKLGDAYRSGGAVEPQPEPHGKSVAPQPSSPDASDPETERLYMGAMMALDPGTDLQPDEREMILSLFEREFGPEELAALEEEVAASQSDGTSDSIPAVIKGKSGDRPAALSEGEFVMPADVVSGLGNGSTDAGARKLMAMIDQVRAGSAQKAMNPLPIKGGGR